jgi:hypothetical protein
MCSYYNMMDFDFQQEPCLQGEVRRVIDSIKKKVRPGLNRDWAARTPAWLAKYAPEVIRVAHGEGRAFSADVLKNAGIQVSSCSVLQ